jgi:hypothetical protein
MHKKQAPGSHNLLVGQLLSLPDWLKNVNHLLISKPGEMSHSQKLPDHTPKNASDKNPLPENDPMR